MRWYSSVKEMGGPFTDITETIFEDKVVLTEEYNPEEILKRDDEIAQYRDALKDVLFGRQPQNVFVYGKAGLGKTAVTTYMMHALEAEVKTREQAEQLFVYKENCNKSTVYQTVRSLVNRARDPDAEAFPKRGLGLANAFESLYEELDRLGGTHLFIFDEIDHLDDADTLLYELPRARANDHLSEAKVGVIGISNNYTFRQELSPKVKDTLMETEISFSPYDADALQAILARRAEAALRDDSYDDAAIAKAAALAARDTGSARQAIDLLREAGNLAERDGSYYVDEDKIERAKAIVRRGRLSNKIRDQTIHAQLVLETLARMERAGELPARSKEIQQRYEQIARSHATDPLTTLKSIQTHLSDLTMLGFLIRTERNEGLSGGYYYEYELDLDGSVVLETREKIEAETA
jgi:orc1/cdc6 family replication initiation protein